MANERKTPFATSVKANKAGAFPVPAGAFRELLCEVHEHEVPGLVRSFVRERVPHIFSPVPLLWESVRSWCSGWLSINAYEIGASGSAQLGFSCKPAKFGHPFSPHNSDLDLFIVNAKLFEDMSREIRSFCSISEAESTFLSQAKTLKHQVGRGFADTRFVHADHARYPVSAKVLNASSIVVDKLKLHSIFVRRADFRCYESWGAYWTQMKVNYEFIRQELLQKSQSSQTSILTRRPS